MFNFQSINTLVFQNIDQFIRPKLIFPLNILHFTINIHSFYLLHLESRIN